MNKTKKLKKRKIIIEFYSDAPDDILYGIAQDAAVQTESLEDGDLEDENGDPMIFKVEKRKVTIE